MTYSSFAVAAAVPALVALLALGQQWWRAPEFIVTVVLYVLVCTIGVGIVSLILYFFFLPAPVPSADLDEIGDPS